MKPGFDFDRTDPFWPHGPGFLHHWLEVPPWATTAFGVVAALLYFLPTLVAYRRRHQNRTAIALLNLLLGWTFFGWALALVWAATAVKPPGQRPA